ncbi:protealysin inhibitor emfourin [Arthrobacter sp. MA-N2]|uniref:protealysin inhibitor emfourin n=1 Tax=Arthrobacter sp. MA-N2 TaxID=1101188 RepID=UPI00048596EA|nr:protealysin inhibitor emfourin [Arthrobacter sp. MA-N2]
MKITVQRSGGVAAITRVWTVNAASSEDRQRWMPIVEACPWDQVSSRRQAGDQPTTRGLGEADRFMYSIRAGQHRATLPETAVTGPWHTLVENAKAEGRETLHR